MRKFFVSFIVFYLSLLGHRTSFPVLSNVFVHTLIHFFLLYKMYFSVYLIVQEGSFISI